MSISNRLYEPCLVSLFRLFDAVIAGILFSLISSHMIQYNVYSVAYTILVILLTLVIFPMLGIYRSWRLSSVHQEISKLLAGCGIVFTSFVLMTGYFYNGGNLPFNLFLVWFLVWSSVLMIERFIVRYALKYLRKSGRNTKTAVIVGSGRLGERFARWMNENPWSGTQILGFFNGVTKSNLEGYPLLGSYNDMLAFVREHNVSSVYIALPMHQSAKIKSIIRQLANTTASVYFIPDLFLYDHIKSSPATYVDQIPVLSIIESPLHGIGGLIKRIEDIIISLMILVVVSPIMLMVSILVKLTSPGSVIFKQWRYGLDGRKIQVWKFRTMFVSEDGYTFNQAKNDDERITPVGRVLRKYFIDELPQFVNVLLGDMSIVGPRPHAITMVDEYRKTISGAMLRHKIKPGITGLAQLFGAHGEIDTVEKTTERLKYDLEYLDKWSILLDLSIIMKTMLFVIRRKVSYAGN